MLIKSNYHLLSILIFFILAACDSDSNSDEQMPEETSEDCIISTREFANSTGIDAIPALINPELATADEVDYLRSTDLVLGLRNGDFTVAIPHKILNWHEIINFNDTSPQLAVTFCPLTGSGITFDRAKVNNLDFGVSGLLWRNNNVMFDRDQDTFSLWSQMGNVALCNSEGEAGKTLDPYPIVEMTWGGWTQLYPNTQVISGNTGFNRNYDSNPLGNYIEPDNTELFWPMPAPIDTRRPPKERVLGIPDGQGGISLPFDEMDKLGELAVIEDTFKGQPIVIFYDRAKRSAWAFLLTDANSNQQFTISEGFIKDNATGSTWQVDGLAIAGPLAGSRLTPIPEAYVSFWFAWAAFQPDAQLWLAN